MVFSQRYGLRQQGLNTSELFGVYQVPLCGEAHMSGTQAEVILHVKAGYHAGRH